MGPPTRSCMGLLKRFTEWFNGYGDEYSRSARSILEEVRRRARARYGDDYPVINEVVGTEMQYHIDAMNNQGGMDAHKHAVARWQIYRALYPEYISDEPPRFVAQMWKNIPSE